MEAPEKLYVDTEDKLSDSILYGFTEKRKDDDIEYISKDSFIEKACKWIKRNTILAETTIERFKQTICKSFGKDIPNHLVTAGYMCGFDDGYKWYMSHPLGVLDEDYAWAVYNFINDWKSGKYGEIELQKALKDNFKF